MKKVTNTQLENLLRSVNVDPSREWKDNTLLQLKDLMNSSKQNSEKTILRRIFFSKIFIISAIAAALLGLLLLTVSFNKVAENPVINSRQKEYLSDTEEKEILSQLVQKNSIKTENIDLSQTETAYNYRMTSYEIRKGPAYSSCLGDKEIEFGNVTQQFYEYVQDDNVFYMWSTKLSDETPINFELTKNKSNSSEWIRYRGGNFALREYSTFVASEGYSSLTEKPNFESIVSEYSLGHSVYQDENGDFVVEQNVRNLIDCDGDKNILSQIIIDPVTFEVKKYQDYLVKEDTHELINESIVTVINNTISLVEADELFKFQFNVEVKNIESADAMPNKETLDRLTRELFRNNEITGLILPEQNYTIEITTHNFDDYSQVYLAQYYARRDYYPAGELGDAMFNSLKNRSENQPVTMGISMRSRTSESEGISLTIAKGDNNYMRLPQFNEKFTPYKSNITINNETVEINVYDSKWPLSDRTTTFFAAERANFNYKGHSYNLTIITQNEQFRYSDYKFTTIETNDPEDLRFIEDHLMITGYVIEE